MKTAALLRALAVAVLISTLVRAGPLAGGDHGSRSKEPAWKSRKLDRSALLVEHRLPGGYGVPYGGWCPTKDAIAVFGEEGVYVWDVLAPDRQPLRIGPGRPHRVTWSHDGRSVAWIWMGPAPNDPLKVTVAPADGSRDALVLEDEQVFALEWTPQGRLLAWDRTGSWREIPLITYEPVGDGSIDSSSVRFVSIPSTRDEEAKLFVVDRRGVRRVPIDAALDRCFESMDGPSFRVLDPIAVLPSGIELFARTFGDPAFLVVDTAGSVIQEVPRGPTASEHYLTVSKDGRWLIGTVMRDSGDAIVDSRPIALERSTGRLDTLDDAWSGCFGFSRVSDRIGFAQASGLVIARPTGR